MARGLLHLVALVLAVAGSGWQYAHGQTSSCPGSLPPGYFEFWTPSANDPPASVVTHASLPASVNGYTLQAGEVGLNEFASRTFQASYDQAGQQWTNGQVDPTTGVPTSTSGGWTRSTTPWTEDFTNGLDPNSLVVLLQKGSQVANVDIVQDTVNGVAKPVLRLAATSDGTKVTSAAIVQSANLYASGSYEATIRFPPVPGLVLTMWTFHYEAHYPAEANQDPQFVQMAEMGGYVQTNHEIDMEIPASCSGMCGSGGGCSGQFDTMNLNNYVFTNNEGTGPAYANLCVRAPAGTSFVDGEYHTYRLDWFSGDGTDACPGHTDFYFDGTYMGSNNVFVPTRGSRLVIGMWPGNNGWVGTPDSWQEAYGYVSSISVTPFNNPGDFMYPQLDDQPDHHPVWTTKTVSPPMMSAAVLPGQLQPPRQPTAWWRQPEALPPVAVGAVAIATLATVAGVLVAVVVIIRARQLRFTAREPLASSMVNPATVPASYGAVATPDQSAVSSGV